MYIPSNNEYYEYVTMTKRLSGLVDGVRPWSLDFIFGFVFIFFFVQICLCKFVFKMCEFDQNLWTHNFSVVYFCIHKFYFDLFYHNKGEKTGKNKIESVSKILRQ